MESEIKVHVENKGRKFLYMRYRCPGTGKYVERSTRTASPKEAAKAAAVWEAELRDGRYQKPSRLTWQAFREYYSANALPGLAVRSVSSYETTLNVFEEICSPQKLADVTTPRLTAFVTELRLRDRSEATIAHHLRHLKASMRWAHREGLLLTLPTFNMPKRAKGSKAMRGRPITLEEFERMLAAIPAVVENAAAASWEFYLRGLWSSGLRLTESLSLRWDHAPGAIVVDFTGRRPMLRIPAEAQKANRDEVLPMAPEFAALLQSVPEAQRRGPVFRFLENSGEPMKRCRFKVGLTVSAIGEKAGVVVDERRKRGETVRKFASAHDLRRGFGQRWAGKVMPTVLRELMRHASLNTTMKFYVGTNAEASADALWNAVGDTLCDTSQSAGNEASGERKKQTAK